MKISLILPMYNEEKIIKNTLQEVTQYMDRHFPEEYEVVVVNDGSSDNSAALVGEVENSRVKLVSYEENRGKGYAIRRGVAAAEGEVLFFTDCDLAYGLEVIAEFYAILSAEGAPALAVGSRTLHPEGYAGYTLLRRFASRAYLAVLRFFGGLTISDSQCGCKGFRAEEAKNIFSLCEVDRFAFDFEAILLAQHFGYRIEEVPVKVIHHGESKVSLVKDSIRMLRDLYKMKKRIKEMEK